MHRRGFTLVELLIVIAVIAVLSAIALPAYIAARNRARISEARTLVRSVSAVVQAASPAFVSATDPATGQRVQYRVADWNRDGLVDGRPVLEVPGPLAEAIESAGYAGVARLVGADLPRTALDPAEQPRDPWQRPLRIAFAARAYGSSAVGIWSLGRDGIDQGGASGSDDIVSWEQERR